MIDLISAKATEDCRKELLEAISSHQVHLHLIKYSGRLGWTVLISDPRRVYSLCRTRRCIAL